MKVEVVKMTSIESLPTPAFVVDLNVLKNNCSRMLEMAKNAGIELRGQIKTHKTVEAAILQTGGTKTGVVTSTFAESIMLAEKGYKNV